MVSARGRGLFKEDVEVPDNETSEVFRGGRGGGFAIPATVGKYRGAWLESWQQVCLSLYLSDIKFGGGQRACKHCIGR